MHVANYLLLNYLENIVDKKEEEESKWKAIAWQNVDYFSIKHQPPSPYTLNIMFCSSVIKYKKAYNVNYVRSQLMPNIAKFQLDGPKYSLVVR